MDLLEPILLDGVKYKLLLKKSGQDIENNFSLLEEFFNKVGTVVIIVNLKLIPAINFLNYFLLSKKLLCFALICS